MKRPQDIGFEWEKDFAKRIGGTIQPGSGNKWWAKLDVKGNKFLWSLKATKHGSFRVDTNMLKEAIDAAQGPGGAGADVVPGMAIRVAGEEFVVLRAHDFIGLMQEEVRFIPPTKREQLRVNSRVPKLLRSQEEDA